MRTIALILLLCSTADAAEPIVYVRHPWDGATRVILPSASNPLVLVAGPMNSASTQMGGQLRLRKADGTTETLVDPGPQGNVMDPQMDDAGEWCYFTKYDAGRCVPAEPIHHRDEIQVAAPQRHISDVAAPDLIGPPLATFDRIGGCAWLFSFLTHMNQCLGLTTICMAFLACLSTLFASQSQGADTFRLLTNSVSPQPDRHILSVKNPSDSSLATTFRTSASGVSPWASWNSTVICGTDRRKSSGHAAMAANSAPSMSNLMSDGDSPAAKSVSFTHGTSTVFPPDRSNDDDSRLPSTRCKVAVPFSPAIATFRTSTPDSEIPRASAGFASAAMHRTPNRLTMRRLKSPRFAPRSSTQEPGLMSDDQSVWPRTDVSIRPIKVAAGRQIK